MRSVVIAAIAAVLVTTGPAPLHGRQGDDVARLEALEQRIASAWVTRDRAFIESVLAPDWSVTDVAGRVLSRQQVLDDMFGAPDRRVDAMAIDDVKVRIFGDTAVVTGRTRASGRDRSGAGSVELRFTDVFVRRDGRWQVVASQGTLIGPPPQPR